MIKTYCLIATLLFQITPGHEPNQLRDKAVDVISKNQPGKEFKFFGTDKTVIYLKYLGQLHSNDGKAFKIVTSIWIWGISHRATNRILVYSEINKYLGNYRLTMITDLPTYVKDNKLVFVNTDKDCDSKLITYLSFSNGIPTEFFRKCKGNSGDIYSFDRN